MEKIFDIKKHQTSIYSLAKGISDTTFLTGSGDGTIGFWDIEKKEVLPLKIKTKGAVFSIYFDSNSEHLILGKLNGDIHVIDLNKKEEIKHILHHKKGVFTIQPLNDNQFITTGGDGLISIWNKEDYTLFRTFPLTKLKLRNACINKKENHTYFSDSEGFIHVLEMDNWQTVYRFHAHNKGVTALALHPTKPVLMTAGNDGHINLYQIEGSDCKLLLKVPAHTGAIYSIVFSPDQKYFATGSRDKSIKIWDANDLSVIDKIADPFLGHKHSVNQLLWSDFNDTLISVSDDATVKAWRMNK